MRLFFSFSDRLSERNIRSGQLYLYLISGIMGTASSKSKRHTISAGCPKIYSERRLSMSYPRPLSEKSLARLYDQSGLSQEQSDYLHKLFAACANLYGSIDLRSVWNLYREELKAQKIRKKDLMAFSGIARRETQPYYIFEVDEIYIGETRADIEREIVSGLLIGAGYGKNMSFYLLQDSRSPIPWYYAKNILDFAEPVLPPEGQFLQTYLGTLKVTASEYAPEHGARVPCENRGKTLNQFSFLNRMERFDESYYASKPAELKHLHEETAGTEAEKIVRQYWQRERIGHIDSSTSLKWVLEELNEVGVELSDKQLNKLVRLLQDFHNGMHLWCALGWRPVDLVSVLPPSMPKQISFGPNMQKQFAEGSLNKEELVRMLHEQGIEVVD